MNFTERHRELIAAVNNAKTQYDHDYAYTFLQGWRHGHMEAFGGDARYDWIDADMQHEGTPDWERPMCMGVFLDWQPEANGKQEAV